MKKLMIAAAAAAMVSGAFASGDAQVYDFSATVKSGVCKAAKVSKKLADYFDHSGQFASVEAGNWEKGDQIGLRKQQTVKIGGVIWGCDCDSIAVPFWGRPRFYRINNRIRYLGGYMFWNQSVDTDADHKGMLYPPFVLPELPALRTTFAWTVLNRIDTMSKCEGAFTLMCTFPGQNMFLQGAGFGSVKKTGCDTYIASMSGNIAGFRLADNGAYGCVFCAANDCIVAPICDTCFESTLGFDSTAVTAVSGTWKLKYNKSATSRLAHNPYLSQVYDFKKAGYAREFLAAVEWLNVVAQGGTPFTAGTTEEDFCEDDNYSCAETEDVLGEIANTYEANKDESTALKTLLTRAPSWLTSEDIEETEESEKFAELLEKALGIGDAS